MSNYKIDLQYDPTQFKNSIVEGKTVGGTMASIVMQVLDEYGFDFQTPGQYLNLTEDQQRKDGSVLFYCKIWSNDPYTSSDVTVRSTDKKELEIYLSDPIVKTNTNEEVLEDIRKILASYGYINGDAQFVKQSGGGGGCYVATSVYGSYDCPEVWTLRRYRDYDLAQTWYGRAFIHTYYAISPTVVKLFGKTQWFKKLFKGRLDRMVKRLQSKGYESTPYNDRRW